MVALYNHVVEYVAALLTSPDVVNLSWPVKEFAEAGESHECFHTQPYSQLHRQLHSQLPVPFLILFSFPAML